MRILALIQLPPPVHGVSLLNAYILQKELLQELGEVSVLRLHFGESADELGRFSLRKVGLSIAFLFRLAWRLIAFRPSVVYFTLCPTGAAFYRDSIFVLLLKLARVKRVYHLHGKGIVRQQGAIQKALYRFVFSNARVIHLSKSLYEDIAAYIAEDRVRYVANCAPDVEMAAANLAPGGVPQPSPAPLRFVFLSNMIVGKGVLDLLAACLVLARRGHVFSVDFAGGWGNDGCRQAYESFLQTHAADLGNRVVYHGPLYGADKVAFMARGGVFVFPSFIDTFPIVLLEAMALSLPVISTREGAIPDIVGDGTSGCLVRPRDIEGLVAAMSSFLENSATVAAMGAQARSRYLALYSTASFERRFSDALQQLVAL